GVGITSREKVAIAKICIHDHGKWIELECALYLSDGLIELAPGCKHDKPKKVVSSCVVGIEFKRAFKFALGFFQIEVSTLQDQTTRDMRFGQVVINCESFVRSRSRFRKNVRWRFVGILRQQHIAISYSGVGWSIIGILRNGLVEVVDRTLEIVSCSFSEEIATSEVQVVCFTVFSRSRSNRTLLRSAQLR